jgi:hypothetical protein
VQHSSTASLAEIEADDELIHAAHVETRLPRQRLAGERGRTAGQLRMFAALVREGSSVIDKMGRAAVDQFARLFVMPHTGHGLAGPAMSVAVTAGEKSLPLCSYPAYPRYKSGDASSAGSNECAR